MPKRLLLAVLLVAGSPLAAQESQSQTISDDPAKDIALGAIEQMSAKLRTLDKFEVDVDATTEEVFLNGEKLQFLNQVRYVVDRPDKLYASIRSDRKYRRIYYNGSTLTVTAPTLAFYATTPMTGTIGDLLDKATEKYGIEFPLQDLFEWGVKDEGQVKPTEAFLVGFAQVGDHATDQYFYRAEGVDFQLWIGRDDQLPYRMVITNTDDPAQPVYTAALTWKLDSDAAPERFTFTPSSDYKLIPLKPDDTVAAK